MSRDFSSVHTIVVKVGTNLLSCKTGIDEGKIQDIVSQICTLKKHGYQVLLVTSGAVGMGAKELGLSHKVSQIAMRQACAAIGQPVLMSSYRQAFGSFNVICSQVLITREQLNNRKTYVNLRNSVGTLLDLGVVPIFNENDAVSTAEIGSAFGDNDRMAAMVASKVDADLLIILSDINGIYTADPKKDTSAVLLSEIEKVDQTILSYAGGAGSTFSTGGMKTKLIASQIASKAGCASIIASGYENNILLRLIEDQETLGSYIHPEPKLKQRERWILNNSHSGSIEVDDGAKKALLAHKSLLPSGVTKVNGTFERGDVIEILDSKHKAFAKAVVYYNSTDIAVAAGHKSSELADILGPDCKDVLFRPEDMVLLED